MLQKLPHFTVTHIPLLQRNKTVVRVTRSMLWTWGPLWWNYDITISEYVRRGTLVIEKKYFSNSDQVKNYLFNQHGLH